MRRSLVTASLLALGMTVVFGAGCGTQKLETGYAYTPLGDSPTKRRGYYADPFSPEARRAQTEQRDAGAAQMDARRPVPGQ
jgi:hypothetical protein